VQSTAAGASGRLDLEHVRPEVGQQATDRLAMAGGEIEYVHSGQRQIVGTMPRRVTNLRQRGSTHDVSVM
jgi:hypothetical protein